MRILTILVTLAAVAVTACVCGCGRSATKSNGTKTEPCPSRVAVYGWGLRTGMVEVDIQHMRLSALGAIVRQPDELAQDRDVALEMRLSADDARSFKLSVMQGQLIGFEPDYSMFKRALADAGTGEPRPGWVADYETRVLVIHCSGRHPTVLKIPPQGLRSHLPKDVQRKYEAAIAIADELERMTAKRASGAKEKPLTPADRDTLKHQLGWASKEALPRMRND